MNDLEDETAHPRIIHKQGYLKKLPNTTKFAASLKRSDRRWFVFGVINNIPFLEYYENEESVFRNSPINTYKLLSCRQVREDLLDSRQPHVFFIHLQDRMINLAAPTRDEMILWCRTLQAKLKEMGILAADKPEHVYQMDPLGPRRPLSTMADNNRSRGSLTRRATTDCSSEEPSSSSSLKRNPSSPLPHPPGLSVELPEGKSTSTKDCGKVNGAEETGVKCLENDYVTEPMLAVAQGGGAGRSQADSSGAVAASQSGGGALISFDDTNTEAAAGATGIMDTTPAENGEAITEEIYEPTWNPTRCTGNTGLTRRKTAPARRVVQDPDAPAVPPRVDSRTPNSRPLSFVPSRITNPEDGADVSPRGAAPAPPVRVSPQSFVLPPKMVEAYKNTFTTTGPPVTGEAPPPYSPEAEAPPPYAPPTPARRQQQQASPVSTASPQQRLMLQRGMSLKESQIEVLKREQANRGGVRVTLRKVDCHHSVAMVDAFGSLWIAGWNQKARPFLYSAFHIGDQVISINGLPVETAAEAQKIIKHASSEEKVAFVVRRVPYAKMFAIKRSAEGESLGFRRDGGTAEIVHVEPDGLAAKTGLSTKAKSVDGTSLCNWVLTEINMRPLNMFFKENEIEHRLNAVGKDISVMVQPVDFIRAIKKLLKNIRHYKDYIVQ